MTTGSADLTVFRRTRRQRRHARTVAEPVHRQERGSHGSRLPYLCTSVPPVLRYLLYLQYPRYLVQPLVQRKLVERREELGQADAECADDAIQQVEGGCLLPSLQVTEVRPVQTSTVSELFLGESALVSKVLDA